MSDKTTRWWRRLWCEHLNSKRALLGYICLDCGKRTAAPFGYVKGRRRR